MGKFLSFSGPAIILAGLGMALIVRFIDHGASDATALVLAGGVYTVALAVYVRD